MRMHTLLSNLGEEERTKVDTLVVKDFFLPESLAVSVLASVAMTYRYWADFDFEGGLHHM